MDQPPELFRWLIEASADGLWIFDDAGVTTYANARMAEILGRDPSSMPGLRVADTLDELGRQHLEVHLAHMHTDVAGEQNVETYFVRPDGTGVWGLCSWSRLPEEAAALGQWLHRITPYDEQRAAREALERSRHQLSQGQQIA
ncbi:MAG: PAS domain S-box protein, partial [Actinobacteria bacterium]|nr:PAS domain S-box protein [Actinomycetota bacterium]